VVHPLSTTPNPNFKISSEANTLVFTFYRIQLRLATSLIISCDTSVVYDNESPLQDFFGSKHARLHFLSNPVTTRKPSRSNGIPRKNQDFFAGFAFARRVLHARLHFLSNPVTTCKPSRSNGTPRKNQDFFAGFAFARRVLHARLHFLFFVNIFSLFNIHNSICGVLSLFRKI